MPQSWIHALDSYSYPVDLSCYERANDFPNSFNRIIVGDRDSTIEFENHFQKNAPNNIAAFFEVVFWKLYSQANLRQNQTSRVVDFVQKHGIKPSQLWNAGNQFVESQNIRNFKRIKELLGFSTDVLAVSLTLPALSSPETIPMIDQQVAKWINQNAANHSVNRKNQLTPFKMNYTTLRQNDFSNYLNWVAWCQEVAKVLSVYRNRVAGTGCRNGGIYRTT